MDVLYFFFVAMAIFWLCCVCWAARCTYLWTFMKWENVMLEMRKGTISPAVVNSFQRLDNSNNYSFTVRALLCFLGTFIVFPLRVLVIFLLLLPIGVLCIGLSLITLKENEPPWNGLHERTIWSKSMARIVSMFLFFLGLVVVDEIPCGTLDSLPRTSCIVSNHVSALDILYFMSRLGFPSFVAKASVTRIPIISYFVRIMGCICIDRISLENRLNALEAIQKRQNQIIASKKMNRLVIFSEGTTSNGRSILPLKRGAFISLHPVTVVVLFYPPSYFHPAFDVIDGFMWVTLLLSSPVMCHLHATWIPYIQPVLSTSEHPQSVSVTYFKDQVRREMLNTLRRKIDAYCITRHEPLYHIVNQSCVFEENWDDALNMKKKLKLLCSTPYEENKISHITCFEKADID